MAFNFPYRQPYNQPYYGWETSVERGDSAFKDVVAPPRYSSGYDDEEDGTIHIEHHHHPHGHQQHVPEVAHHRPQRARFADSVVELPDHRERRPMIKPKEEKKVKGGVIRSVDDAADGFIKAKHLNFEARQWNTFRM